MSNYCTSCGIPIPDHQRSCSMCYGDIDHGTDGYYKDWAENEIRRQQEKREEYERWVEEHEREEEDFNST